MNADLSVFNSVTCIKLGSLEYSLSTWHIQTLSLTSQQLMILPDLFTPIVCLSLSPSLLSLLPSMPLPLSLLVLSSSF